MLPIHTASARDAAADLGSGPGAHVPARLLRDHAIRLDNYLYCMYVCMYACVGSFLLLSYAL